MSKNKVILWMTIFGSILIIALPTVLKIYKNHQDRLYQVATKKITETALDCFHDDVCEEPAVTLSELKKNGYLEFDVVDPETKTYFPDDVVLIYDEYQVILKK